MLVESKSSKRILMQIGSYLFILQYYLFLAERGASSHCESRSADAWGTMKNINPELWTEKGLVKNSDSEVIPDLSPDEDVFNVTVTESSELFFEINIGNTGEENGILEFVVFTSTDPGGVDINNSKVELKSGETHTKIIHIDTDHFEPGTSSFDVIVNSNGQMGVKYKTYRIIVHKEYDTYYQDFSFPKEKPTVLQKSQSLTRYTYTGREYNRETGQYYYRARTYTSGLGRFTGKDSVGYPGYNYVKNNPMRYNDSFGKKKTRWPEFVEWSKPFVDFTSALHGPLCPAYYTYALFYCYRPYLRCSIGLLGKYLGDDQKFQEEWEKCYEKCKKCAQDMNYKKSSVIVICGFSP